MKPVCAGSYVIQIEEPSRLAGCDQKPTVYLGLGKKISKIAATRCQILRPKWTKFDFPWGSAPHPAGGAYSAPPDPLAVFKGAYF